MSAKADDLTYPWERIEGEPAEWFARFDVFRLLGPVRRSVIHVYRAEKPEAGRAPGQWWKAWKRWKWVERAEAWDAHERALRLEQLAAEQEALRLTLLAIANKGIAETQRQLDAITARPVPADMDIADVVKLGQWSADLARDCLVLPQVEAIRKRLAELEQLNGAAGRVED